MAHCGDVDINLRDGTGASSSDSDNYNMNYPKRGIALIINNENFDAMGKREGTSTDENDLRNLLNMLGFEVKTKQDLTAMEMKAELNSVSKEEFEDKACFVCVILSHGGRGCVYGTDAPNDYIELEDILTPFKANACKSLAGKPKLFFIQACRGNSFDDGVDVSVAVPHDGEGGDDDGRCYIPAEEDFLVACSSIPGYYSMRNPSTGSWFIQALVEVFKSYWKTMDVLRMMTRVNNKVALGFESKNKEDPTMAKKKQIPCVYSMLTKDVKF